MAERQCIAIAPGHTYVDDQGSAASAWIGLAADVDAILAGPAIKVVGPHPQLR